MVGCSAFKCTNRNCGKKSGITFHKFPKNEERRALWVAAVRRKNWTPSCYSSLCSVHFKEECFDRTSLAVVRLRENAVPTIFASHVIKPKVELLPQREASPDPYVELPQGEASPDPYIELPQREESPDPYIELPQREASPDPYIELPQKEASPDPYIELPQKEASPDPYIELPQKEAPTDLYIGLPQKKATTDPYIEQHQREASPDLYIEQHQREASPDPYLNQYHSPSSVSSSSSSDDVVVMEIVTSMDVAVKDQSAIQTPTEKRLWVELERNRFHVDRQRRKIKVLQQKNRRMTKRVAALNNIISDLKTDLSEAIRGQAVLKRHCTLANGKFIN